MDEMERERARDKVDAMDTLGEPIEERRERSCGDALLSAFALDKDVARACSMVGSALERNVERV